MTVIYICYDDTAADNNSYTLCVKGFTAIPSNLRTYREAPNADGLGMLDTSIAIEIPLAGVDSNLIVGCLDDKVWRQDFK